MSKDLFTFKRNLRSSFETPVESHSHSFQVPEGLDEATDAGFSATD